MGIKEKLSRDERLKRFGNRKIILGSLAILFAMVFIGVTSFVPFIITKEKLGSEKFWTDELIIIAITIFSMISAMFIGQASNAQNPESKIARSKVGFVASVSKIINTNAFCQWVKKVLQPNDMQAIKERELRKCGIDDYTILKLTDSEIKQLENAPQKYNGRYYSQLNKSQVEAIFSLRNSVKEIKMVEPEYYLTVSSIDINRTDSEKSGRENLIKSIKLIFSIVSKIMFVLIPALIFGALARDLTQGDVDQAEAWAAFIVRMFNMITSAFMGYIVGCQMNDIDADFIELRIRVHNKYLQDTAFVAKNQQELARDEFIERVNKENKKYTESLELKDREDTVIGLPVVKEETK